MTTTIRISDDIVQKAQVHGNVYNRSVPKQIEFWATIGRIAEGNPDMTYNDIREILFAVEEAKLGHVEEFKFSS